MKWLLKYYWAIIPLIGWLIVRYMFGFDGLYGQDAYAYLLHAREWRSFLLGGVLPGYFFWPPNYSIIGGVLAITFDSEFVSLQLISVLSLMGSGYFADRIIRETTELNEGVRLAFVTLGLLLSPYIFRLGMQGMSDMMTMCFLLGSFWFFHRTITNSGTNSMIGFSIFTALALTSRYPSIVVLIIPIIVTGYTLLSSRKFGILMIGLLAGSVILIPAIAWKWQWVEIWASANNFDGLYDWSVSNFFRAEFHRKDSFTSHLLPNILFNLSAWLHPGLLLFTVVLFPFLPNRAMTTFRWTILYSILAYILFLSGVPFQNSRVLTFIFPLILIFMAPAFGKFVELMNCQRFPIKSLFAIALVIQVGLTARALKPSVELAQFENELVDWIGSDHPTKTIYTSAFSQLFDAHETGNPTVQVFDSKVVEFQTGGLYIFNHGWSKKLEGTMVMENWNRANSSMNVAEHRCWPNGWCVYQLSEK